jgi:hypothetical protein
LREHRWPQALAPSEADCYDELPSQRIVDAGPAKETATHAATYLEAARALRSDIVSGVAGS